MAKECEECRTISNDDAPYCEACGGSDWKTSSRLNYWRLTFAVIVLLFLVGMVWWFGIRI